CCQECRSYAKQSDRDYDNMRGNSGERGYDRTWQHVSLPLIKLGHDLVLGPLPGQGFNGLFGICYILNVLFPYRLTNRQMLACLVY
ncbi:MAG: hypothetical protein SV375_20515, partial [Thermodesulfobacteriota bacterium]|nr:hypothetical protein [Thermodesulfobacteriota bacterium]